KTELGCVASGLFCHVNLAAKFPRMAMAAGAYRWYEGPRREASPNYEEANRDQRSHCVKGPPLPKPSHPHREGYPGGEMSMSIVPRSISVVLLFSFALPTLAADLLGKVMHNGQPRANVEVILQSADARGNPLANPPPLKKRSDDAGNFVFSGIAPG